MPRFLPSVRAELLIVLAMFVVVNAATALVQAQIGINDGKGWDGSAYYALAQQMSDGQPLAAEAPFAYRVGTPFLAALFFKNDLILGFKVVNMAANAVTTLLLVVWFRLFVGDWRVRLALLAAFLLQWHGPVRFVHFYPVASDNWFIAILLAGLLGIYAARRHSSWLLVGGIGVLAALGVLVRESGMLLAFALPLARNPLRFAWRLPRFPFPFLIPLGLAVSAFAGVHAVAHITNNFSGSEGAPLIVPKSAPTYLLGWWTAFGLLLVFPLFHWRRTLAFLWEHQFMAGLLLAVTLLSSFSSPALQLQLQDTERYLFWAMPIVFVLVGRAIERSLPLLSWPLLALIVAGQSLAERVFWTIPQPGGGDPSLAFERSTSALLVLTPVGGNVQYFDIFPSWMSQAYRLILLAEYVGLAAIVIVWLYWRAARSFQAEIRT
jgi:hypothetical protein